MTLQVMVVVVGLALFQSAADRRRARHREFERWHDQAHAQDEPAEALGAGRGLPGVVKGVWSEGALALLLSEILRRRIRDRLRNGTK